MDAIRALIGQLFVFPRRIHNAIRALIGHKVRFMIAIGNVIGCHNKE